MENEPKNTENESEDRESKSKNEEYLHQIQKKIDELKGGLQSLKHRWLGVLWVITIFIILSQNKKIRTLNNQMQILQNGINNVNGLLMSVDSDVRRLDDSVAEQVEQRMQQVMSEMNSYEIKYTEINPVKEEVTAKIIMNLKRYDKSAEYYAEVKSLGGERTIEEKFIGDGIQRICTLALPADSNYSVAFYKRTSEGGELLSMEDITIAAVDCLNDRVEYSSMGSTRGNGIMARTVELRNHTYGFEDARIGKVEAILSYYSKEFATIQMTESTGAGTTIQGQYGDSSSTVSGSYSSSYHTDGYSSTIEDDIYSVNPEDEVKSYELYLTEDEVRELLGVSEEEEVAFYDVMFQIKVTFRDGTSRILDGSWSIY